MPLKKQPTRKYLYVAIGGLAVNEQGKVLITQRNDPRFPDIHEKWQIPGGALEFGETPEQTLRRELKEEIGVDVDILGLIPYIGSSVFRRIGYADQIILINYLVKIKPGQNPSASDQETLAYQWIKPKEINQYQFLPLADIIIQHAQPLISQYLKKASKSC